MRVLFASSEVSPLLKSGGLADFSSSLPKALARAGHPVTVGIPHFDGIAEGTPVSELDVPVGDDVNRFAVRRHDVAGPVEYLTFRNLTVPWWGDGGAYRETAVRPYLAFGRAVVEYVLNAPQRRVDVLHCNDWHTGHCASYLRQRAPGRRPGTVLTVHNAAYRGPLTGDDLALAGPAAPSAAPSLLAQGIDSSDKVVTVSPCHREELLTRRLGMGLEDLLRRRSPAFHGIMNGLDYEEFDPSNDTHLPHPIEDGDQAARRRNKAHLQAFSGLPVDPAVPVVGVVARLAEQKGAGLLLASLDAILALGVQVVACGIGQGYEEFFQRAARRYDAVAYHADAGEPIARLIYGGADIVLTPSRYEPFGLVPLIALRYGALPVARLTGGMLDTVGSLARQSPPLAAGFTGYTTAALRSALARAVTMIRSDDEPARSRAAMRVRYDWTGPMQDYLAVYRQAIHAANGEDPS